MEQLGHTDPSLTLRVYARALRHSPQERERLRALVYCDVRAAAEPASPAPAGAPGGVGP